MPSYIPAGTRCRDTVRAIVSQCVFTNSHASPRECTPLSSDRTRKGASWFRTSPLMVRSSVLRNEGRVAERGEGEEVALLLLRRLRAPEPLEEVRVLGLARPRRR